MAADELAPADTSVRCSRQPPAPENRLLDLRAYRFWYIIIHVTGKRRPRPTKRTPPLPASTGAALPPPPPSAVPPAPKLTCRFYRTAAGNEPVREWLKSLPPAVRKEVGSDILVVQWRWPLSKPLVDGFGGGLYEVRTSHDGNIYRTLFCLEGAVMVLLHAFMKKSKKTPIRDIDIAKARRNGDEES